MYAFGPTPTIFDACSALVRLSHEQPDDFHVYRMEVLTEGGDHNAIIGWKVTGVRCMPYVRGKQKGQPNYGRRLAKPITCIIAAGKASAKLREMEGGQ
ncbi:hypothetical protein FVW20_00575 [Desulfovibrio oxamicus]|uniref:Uncharacterized protein n=1 Tax=Nitratidesulfovibrio oxamicus TaxID=32016 RepID=A0ABS0IZE6_9BACT|nr:hypothetical protein [Nitratidesulfovibrio oxamicus]MBG3875558.1 hypothetical protein [Nitratidesulfovibrio oxamicus]